MYDNPLHLVRIVGPAPNVLVEHQQHPRFILTIRKVYYRPIGIYIGIFFAGLGVVECIYYFFDNSFKLWEMVLYLYISILFSVSLLAWCLYYICCKRTGHLEDNETTTETV